MALKFLPGLASKLNVEEVGKEIFGKCGYKDGMRFFDMTKEEGQDPLQKLMMELEVKLKAAMVDKAQAQAVTESVKSLYSAMQTAQTAVMTQGGVTAVADAIAKSAGFVDKDAGTIYPPETGAVAQQPVPVEANTHPMYPANAEAGMTSGMQTQTSDDEGMGYGQ